MLKNTMQISYWTIGGFEGTKPPEQALLEAKKMGYDGVELTFDGAEFGPGITEERVLEIKKAAKAVGVKIDSLASGFYWGKALSSPNEKERKEAVEYTKEYLKVASLLGVKVVLIVPGAVAVPWDGSRPVVPYKEVWKNATKSIKACLKTAEKYKVTMAFENVWNWFLADPVAMNTFIDQFGSKFVGVYFDVANCLINGYPEHWIEMLGKRIKAVHFKNFSRNDDCGGGLHGFGDDIMTGDINWKAVVKALDKIKFKGPITAEMIPFSRLPDLVLPDLDMAKDTAKKMKKIFKM